ncbi:GH36-type glycosyl hydrolase domain-containing protein [uncultured Eubacterium sp.]|uniref:GH36-type glycosyl hydrolase domain-containing protein n=1 Tax=uncultured Eubacterium sp. TaxID=165185 RepID=UPI00261DA2B1|nr:cellobiose phosphorylase [uncultured Eubacterium sp.]
MGNLNYLDKKGTFTLDDPDLTSYMYFPLANEAGMMSSITPDLNGDIKLDQNTFLLEPVSSENLHNNKSSRNFWVYVEGKGAWSVTGRSSKQQAKLFEDDKEKVKLTAGIMWHQVERESDEMELKAVMTSFVPNTEEKVELTKFEITNTSDKEQKITSTVAIPLYARSASNIRDHRHVTSLLHRTFTVKNGIMIHPTLTFDERGHNKNKVYYGALAKEEVNGEMVSPISFCPVTEEFIGHGGNFENPYYVMKNEPLPYKVGEEVDGYETVAAIRFEDTVLAPGETRTYIVALGFGESEAEITEISKKYLITKHFDRYLEETKEYWQKKINVSYNSSDTDFDNWMHWVNFQPMLRRIYGCSFLPHHDYGKGGRGWRDLWQDCLALLIMEPEQVRQMLIDNFGGVRFDGTNATIIGSKQGEFIADRNNIVRVWMDHGAWPYLTTSLYIEQTGDIEFLREENTYFKDAQIHRGEDRDERWNDSRGNKQMTTEAEPYRGTVLEHLLIQHLTSFYDVGEHNHIRLRGADWNDGLDMANDRGESVAFTALYGGNMRNLAKNIKAYEEKTGKNTITLAKEILILIDADKSIYNSIGDKHAVLDEYCESVKHIISGEKVEVPCDKLIDVLNGMSDWIGNHIRKTEWLSDKDGYSWFNGYYDNSGKAVEGDFETGVRMMLTGQVFAIMSETATKEQVAEIVKATDKYLYDEKIGGYRLNTNFNEVKTDLGRLFGFAFGHKENGAVFSHMAVMYANALYSRGFAKEGYKVINTLYKHCNDYNLSNIYPGVPEYVNQRGQGMYHYLTGAASWLLLTVLNEMYGIKGQLGALKLQPKLLATQFTNGMASATCMFRGVNITVTYQNPFNLEVGNYRVKEIYIDGEKYSDGDTIAKEDVDKLGDKSIITAVLG